MSHNYKTISQEFKAQIPGSCIRTTESKHLEVSLTMKTINIRLNVAYHNTNPKKPDYFPLLVFFSTQEKITCILNILFLSLKPDKRVLPHPRKIAFTFISNPWCGTFSRVFLKTL